MKVSRIATLLLCISFLVGLSRAGRCENRAIVFGCNGSESSGETRLDYAESDAQKMAAQLTRTGGLFDEQSVRLYSTGEKVSADRLATKENLLKGLAWLAEAGPEDTVLFYFSGHGGQGNSTETASDTEKSARLVTYDYTSTNTQTGFPVVELHRRMNSLKALNGITLLDSCFSGIEVSVARRPGVKLRLVADVSPDIGAKDTRAFKFGQSLLNTQAPVTTQGRNRILLTSCQSSERSFEINPLPGASTGGGLFTHFLCKGLNGDANVYPGDGGVTSSEIVAYVQYQLRQYLDECRSKGWGASKDGSAKTVALSQTPRATNNAANFPLSRTQQVTQSTEVVRLTRTAPPAAEFSATCNATNLGNNRYEIYWPPNRQFVIKGIIDAPAGLASVSFDNTAAPNQQSTNPVSLPSNENSANPVIKLASFKAKDTAVFGFSRQHKVRVSESKEQPRNSPPQPDNQALPVSMGAVLEYRAPEAHRSFEISEVSPEAKQTFVFSIADNLGRKTEYQFTVIPTDESRVPAPDAPLALVIYDAGTEDNLVKQYGIDETTASTITQMLARSGSVNTAELSSSMLKNLLAYSSSPDKKVQDSTIAKCLRHLLDADLIIQVKWHGFTLPFNETEDFAAQFSYTFYRINKGEVREGDITLLSSVNPLDCHLDQKALTEFGWPTPAQWRAEYKDFVVFDSDNPKVISSISGHPHNKAVQAIVNRVINDKFYGVVNDDGMLKSLKQGGWLLPEKRNSPQNAAPPPPINLT